MIMIIYVATHTVREANRQLPAKMAREQCYGTAVQANICEATYDANRRVCHGEL